MNTGSELESKGSGAVRAEHLDGPAIRTIHPKVVGGNREQQADASWRKPASALVGSLVRTAISGA